MKGVYVGYAVHLRQHFGCREAIESTGKLNDSRREFAPVVIAAIVPLRPEETWRSTNWETGNGESVV